MRLSEQEKQQIRQDLINCLKDEPEVRRVIIFGSFPSSSDPHDLDVAVFQDSDQPFLPLTMKYRKLTRPIARRIPMDILPIRRSGASGWFMDEVNRGEIIYER